MQQTHTQDFSSAVILNGDFWTMPQLWCNTGWHDAHTHNLRSTMMLNGTLWTVPSVMVWYWLVVYWKMNTGSQGEKCPNTYTLSWITGDIKRWHEFLIKPNKNRLAQVFVWYFIPIPLRFDKRSYPIIPCTIKIC